MSLAPNNQLEYCNSPGSSIFDLPTTSDIRSASQSNTHFSTEAPIGDGPKHDGVAAELSDLEDDDVPSCLVISGGTGCNAICSAFGTSNASYVLPVSDDGGSSSEIIRVIGGPSIGE